MKLIIAGSRTIIDMDILHRALSAADIYPQDVKEIFSGMAIGVDMLAVRLAKKNNILLRKFPAEWGTYGKVAGNVRNREMAEKADKLLAVWDGKSTGTKHMINVMGKLFKPAMIYKIDGSFSIQKNEGLYGR